MKRKFLVNYDYGMGGAWAYVMADSEEQIADRYPELSVVHDPPAWLTEAERDHLGKTLTLDIDEPGSPILRQLLERRP